MEINLWETLFFSISVFYYYSIKLNSKSEWKNTPPASLANY